MKNSRVQTAELARFIPTGILTRLAKDPQPLTAPQRERFLAAALFADISGFTRLSEQLAARGAEGVETLTLTLNAYFGQLIEVIAGHGGDVVKFAGDALLALWRAEDEAGLKGAVAEAARCAEQAQIALREFAAPDGVMLGLRLGIGAGAATMFTLGGVFGRWESVVCGAPVAEATLAATTGSPGEVMVGAAAWAQIADNARAEATVGGSFRLTAAPASSGAQAPPLQAPTLSAKYIPLLRSYIPAAAWRKLEAGQSAWLAELRRLTVLFVNLPDLNADTPVERAQTLMQALQNGLYRYEGSVNKLSIDEKGVTLVAALGLPPLAHENDPLRGIRAALEIQTRLTALDCHGAVGVTSGRVFCGTVGSERRCEYTIIGDTVNLSARLMQAAKQHGGILCDSPTRAAGRERIEFEKLLPVTVKGKEKPVPIYRPLGEAKSGQGATDQAPMVGRSAELTRMREWIDSIKAGAPRHTVIIEGEAGIGKSRFVAALREAAREAGTPTLYGAVDSIERNTPYFAWRPVFQSILEVSGAAVEEARLLPKLEFDSELARLAPLLGVVLAAPIEDNEVTVHMSQEARITSTNALLLRLLEHRAERQPLMLVLEDCQWLDSASWLLVRTVAQAAKGILLVLVTRPMGEEAPSEFSQILKDPATVPLPLSMLSPEDTLALVCQRLEVRSLPQAVADLIGARAQGHPFYAEELAYTLRDKKLIEIVDGECRVATGKNLGGLEFPDTLQGVVTSRIDLLSLPAQMMLKVASVIGRVFSCRLLRDVFPISGETQNQGMLLEVLLRLDLTRVEAKEPEPRHMFRHMITQEVAYQLMPAGQRGQLHQAVAEWYEEHHRSDLAAYYPLLVKHWGQTPRVEKTIDYCEKAAEAALRQYANKEAVQFFQQALDLDEKQGLKEDAFRRARWLRQLAQAYYNLSDYTHSLEAFRQAVALLGHPMPVSSRQAMLKGIKLFLRQTWRQLLPLRPLGPDSPEGARLLEAARAYERMAQLAYLDNDRGQTIHAVFKSLTLAARVGPSGVLARAQSAAAVVTGLMMLHGAARAQAARARATAEAVDEPPTTAYVEYLRGMYWNTVGEWEKSLHDLTITLTVSEATGERRRWCEAMFTLAKVHSRQGNLPLSEDYSARLVETGQRIEAPAVEIWGLEWQTWVAYLMGDQPEKERALRARLVDGLGKYLSDIPLADQLLGHGIAARSYWGHGRREEALASAAQALAIINRTSQVAHYILPAFTGLAQIAYEQWEQGGGNQRAQRESKVQLARLVRSLSEFRLMYPVGVPGYRLHRGQLHWAQGRGWLAHRAWRKGIIAAQRLRMPYEEGLLHLQTGECLEAPAARRQALENALALFQRIGARREQSRAEATLNPAAPSSLKTLPGIS